MSDALEAYGPEGARLRIVFEHVQRAVGCPTCGGTGEDKLRYFDEAGCLDEEIVEPCPEDHAEFTVFGETIYGDSDKCDWLCDDAGVFASALLDADGVWICDSDSNPPEDHEDCGWQPKWGMIFGGETCVSALKSKFRGGE